MIIIFNFNEKEKKKSEKNLNTSINLILRNTVIKKNSNISHLIMFDNFRVIKKFDFYI